MKFFGAGTEVTLSLNLPMRAKADATSDAVAYNQQYQTDLMNSDIATQQQMQQQQFFEGLTGQLSGCFIIIAASSRNNL